jgi:hypothetical protein
MRISYLYLDPLKLNGPRDESTTPDRQCAVSVAGDHVASHHLIVDLAALIMSFVTIASSQRSDNSAPSGPVMA